MKDLLAHSRLKEVEEGKAEATTQGHPVHTQNEASDKHTTDLPWNVRTFNRYSHQHSVLSMRTVVIIESRAPVLLTLPS